MSADMLANLSPMGKLVRPIDIGGIGGAPGGVGCKRILLLGLLWYCGGGTTERDIKGLVTCLLLLLCLPLKGSGSSSSYYEYTYIRIYEYTYLVRNLRLDIQVAQKCDILP